MSKHALDVSPADSFNVRYSDLFGPTPKIKIRFEDSTSKIYDERIERGATDRELIESLKKYGQIVPAQGTKDAGLVDGMQVVSMIDGRQRWMHIQQAWTELIAAGAKIEDLPPFRIEIKRYASDVDKFEAGIVANAHRLNDSPMVTARKINQYLSLIGDDTFGRIRALALFNLKSEVVLSNTLALLNLAPEIQAKVTAGEMGASAAFQLTSLNHVEQKAALANVAPGATVETVRAAARIATGKKVTPKVLSRSVILDRIAQLRVEMSISTDVNRSEQMAARIDELHFVLGER